MTEKELTEYLEYLGTLGRVPGLDNIRELCKRLGDPQDDLCFIHVAGTNGKGSVTAYLSAAFRAAGLRVGVYNSPTISDYRERIVVGGRMIAKRSLLSLMDRVKTVCDEMTAEGLAHPTSFEVETALGFLYFLEKKCDIVILECGMGGLLDATNVVSTTLMEIITPIGDDHAEYLGDTLEKIAAQKAGIIKKGSLMVSAAQPEGVRRVLEEKCEREGAKAFFCEPDEIDKVRYGLKKQSFRFAGKHTLTISLAGTYQIANAHLAAKALYVLMESAENKISKKLTDAAIAEGLRQAVWPGRFEVLSQKPVLIADGAHNRPAASVLAASLRQYFEGRRIVFILGVFRDKDVDGILEETAGLAAQIITITLPEKERSLDALSLAQSVSAFNPNVTTADSVEEALEMARLLAGKEGVIVAFGSLSYLGKLRALAGVNAP